MSLAQVLPSFKVMTFAHGDAVKAITVLGAFDGCSPNDICHLTIKRFSFDVASFNGRYGFFMHRKGIRQERIEAPRTLLFCRPNVIPAKLEPAARRVPPLSGGRCMSCLRGKTNPANCFTSHRKHTSPISFASNSDFSSCYV